MPEAPRSSFPCGNRYFAENVRDDYAQASWTPRLRASCRKCESYYLWRLIEGSYRSYLGTFTYHTTRIVSP
ncbi:hypothetical protein A0H81_12821 [Grifola frondosa]|uniref:Uncharacterized protein n=1 Tax=Grifola frondosa TaxID=5627 RepID=A0A1C7LQM8_GRIFR|nr:hypothetical protein A0H81_12821 [Grifola frondosa]